MNADGALELLLTSDMSKAQDIATTLQKLNAQRQHIEETILQQVFSSLDRIEPDRFPRFIVVSGEGWNEGVIGIVASRLVERYYRPTVVLSIMGEKAKGSARSIPGFHLLSALQRCSDLFDEFGGHKVAAGLSIATHKIPQFAQRIDSESQLILSDDMLIPKIELIGELTLDQVTDSVVQMLKALEPFGIGNPRPLFCWRNLQVGAEPKRIGAHGKHLRLILSDGNRKIASVGFGMGDKATHLTRSSVFDIVGYLDINHWNNNETVQLLMKDMVIH